MKGTGLPVDQGLKEKWLAALESGEFKKATGQLREGPAYCCLGVLCVVAGLPLTADGMSILGVGPDEGYKPLRELITGDPEFGVGDPIHALIDLNDNSFNRDWKAVAAYIREKL